MTTPVASRGLAAPVRLALLLAAVLSIGLVAFGLFYPAYGRHVQTSDGTEFETSATIVEVNGPGVLVTLSVPLLATALVTILLAVVKQHWRRTAAWVVVGLLLAFALLGIATIGMLVLPIGLALAFATAWAGRPVSARATG
ncbi:MAG: hypothetical protein ACK5H2_02955 [Beutenbergiaceae bacterium]